MSGSPRVLTEWPETVRTENAVLGSGPGGAITAALLAEAGREVMLLEEGPYLRLDSCAPFSRAEMVTKYRNGGITVAMGQAKIAYVEGRCVGGGSEINSGLYHRTPPEILADWQQRLQLEHATPADLEPYFAANERDLTVSYLPVPAPAASLKLHHGALALGWKSFEVPRWFRHDASGSGRRQSMTETFIPRFLQAGGTLAPNARVRRLERFSGGWRVEIDTNTAVGLQRTTLLARRVFVACGAIQTPLLLRRSGITSNVGRTLHLHPTVKVVARFPDAVNAAGMGVPVHQVKEFAPRFSFGCSISSPAHQALALAEHPEELARLEETWPRTAIYYAMTSGGRGDVRGVPFFDAPWVRYRLQTDDLTELADGLRRLCEALLAAGAEVLFPSISGVAPLRSTDDLARLPEVLPAARTSLMTIHLVGSCPAGQNRQRCAVDSFGRVYGQEGLFVADASLLGGAPGVNPQGSVMALVRRNCAAFLAGRY